MLRHGVFSLCICLSFRGFWMSVMPQHVVFHTFQFKVSSLPVVQSIILCYWWCKLLVRLVGFQSINHDCVAWFRSLHVVNIIFPNPPFRYAKSGRFRQRALTFCNKLADRIGLFKNGTRRFYRNEKFFRPNWPYSGMISSLVIGSSRTSVEPTRVLHLRTA